jgi:hypothetical protein
MPRKRLDVEVGDSEVIRVAGRLTGAEYKVLVKYLRSKKDARTGKPVKMDRFVAGILRAKIKSIRAGKEVKF